VCVCLCLCVCVCVYSRIVLLLGMHAIAIKNTYYRPILSTYTAENTCAFVRYAMRVCVSVFFIICVDRMCYL
jgi:hypothetical protein